MDHVGSRLMTSQLAEDLSWLESYCRRQPDQAAQAGLLRLAAALVRNCIGPFLDDQPPAPLHLAVVGGAGAGKSTVVNFLSGADAAEANPQAGYTRHPIAYTGANGPLGWPAHVGFLSPLKRLEFASPANLDQDVYQVRRVPADPAFFSLLKEFVVWDCPDMTTWAATGYAPRLLEIAGLADAVVYVASDERYNDEVPTQFLELLLLVGKPVIVCLTKMREEDAESFITHFKTEVLTKLPNGAVSCLAIPHLSPVQLADPVNQAARWRIPLMNQVGVLGQVPAENRLRSVLSASNFLVTASDMLLGVARDDLAALQSWREQVSACRVEFDNRYRREYLTTEKFRRFDEALVRLMELLELPGVGRVVSGTLWVMRTPYRLLKGLAVSLLKRPDSLTLPEQTVLEGALAGWLDHLRTEAVRQSSTHPLWAHVARGFEAGLAETVRDRYQQGFRNFQLGLADEVDRTARAIYEELEKNPTLLNTLRGSKLAIELGSIVGTVAIGHWSLGWHDLILVPLATSFSHQLVEWFGKHYVDRQREQTRNRQQALVSQYISGPLAEWLIHWPTTGGSDYERLHLALQRVPSAIRQLHAAVGEKLLRDKVTRATGVTG